MALVEVIFRDRIGNYNRGQVVTLDSETPFFKALIAGKKAEIVNPPDWRPSDGKSDHQQSDVAEAVPVKRVRRSGKKSEESSSEAPEHSSEGYGGPGEIVEDRASDDSGEAADTDSLGRSEYQSYPGGDEGSL